MKNNEFALHLAHPKPKTAWMQLQQVILTVKWSSRNLQTYTRKPESARNIYNATMEMCSNVFAFTSSHSYTISCCCDYIFVRFHVFAIGCECESTFHTFTDTLKTETAQMRIRTNGKLC